jgi:glycosyltransferase involved in cell wall biosynthesis
MELRRLLFVTGVDLAARNGPAKHVMSLVSHLARAGAHEGGFAVTVLARQPSTDITSDLSAIAHPHLTFAFVGTPAKANNGGKGTASALPALLVGLLRQPQPDAVYLRSSVFTIALAMVARRWRSARLIVEANSWNAADLAMLGHNVLTARIAEILQALEARLAHGVRTVTAAISDQYRRGGVPAANLHVIGNGADLATFRPLEQISCRQALGLPQQVPILAMIGNLWSAIDLTSVFQALRRLNVPEEGAGRNIHLVIAGDGPDRARFESIARTELGAMAESHVRWLGAVSHCTANKVLGAADAGLAPFTVARNRVTGLSPLKVRECAAAGRPCIGTALPGLEELGSERWMYLAAADDGASWALAIGNALAEDPRGPAAATRAAARAYAEAHFDWATITHDVVELIFPDKLRALK